MKEKPAPKKPRVVEIVLSDYQPSKAELAEPIVLDTTFEKLTQAVVQPATIRTIARPKNKSRRWSESWAGGLGFRHFGI